MQHENKQRIERTCKPRKETTLFCGIKKMQEKGLEPSWYCYHTDLNRARLPIPPFLQTTDIISAFFTPVNRFAKNYPTFLPISF